ELKEGKYEIKSFDPEKDYFRKPSISLFSQGDIISLMKERGIGRPSTYATIISKILERKYAISRKNKLIATKRGKEVYQYLKAKFEKYISEELTRDLERKMDLIEENKIDYLEILKEIYRESMEIKNIF
ncbi:MAG: DNA topoisomerase, partial [Candidatus Aenigmatarchaeota archaeon]